MKKENISDAVIRRLPRYYRQLTDLYHRGIVRTSSHSLGQEILPLLRSVRISVVSVSLASRDMDTTLKNFVPRSVTFWVWTTITISS